MRVILKLGYVLELPEELYKIMMPESLAPRFFWKVSEVQPGHWDF